MNRNLYQVRYLPNDQYKSILVSEVFEIPILHKPKLTANLKNPKKVIVQWEFPDAYQPNYYDWIGLFFKDEANINFLSWKYNTNTTRKGKLEFPLFHFQTNEEREFVFRYLPNNKYQEIGESEPFKLKYEIKNIELSIPKQEFEYGESVTVEWNFPKEFPVSSKDWIGLYYSTSNSKQYITYQYNSSSTRKGKATFDFSLFKNTDILNTFQMRYLPQDSYFLQFSSKPFRFKFLQKSGIEIPTKNPQFGSPLYFQIKLPEDYTPNISDSFAIFFNESIDQNTNQEPDPLLEIRNTQLSRFGILNFQLDFDLQKKIDELGNQNQSNLFVIKYISHSSLNEKKILLVSSPFKIDNIQNIKLTVSKKQISFGESIDVGWELPGYYHPNYYDWIGLYVKGTPNNSYLTYQYNSFESIKGKMTFDIGNFITDQDQIFEFRYLPNDKYISIAESEEIKVKSKFKKQTKLTVSKKQISFGESIDVEWELPKNYKPNYHDWIGLYVKGTPNNSYLTYQYNNDTSIKGKMTFDIGNFITDQDQIFEFRYLPKDRYISIAESEEIKVKSEFKKQTKLTVSKNQISFGESIDVEWELPENYKPNYHDWIGLYVKGTPNNSYLTYQYNNDTSIKGKMTFDIGNFITDQDQIFEFRYLPKDRYLSIAESEEIKVKSEFKKQTKLTVSKNQISFGESIDVGWELPDYYHPNYHDWIGLYVKGTPNNSYLTYQYNSSSTINGKMTFSIWNYIKDQDQIFEFRYLPNDRYLSIAESEGIQVRQIVGGEINTSSFESKIGDRITISWQLPNDYEPQKNDQLIFFRKQFQSKDQEMPKNFQFICYNEKCERKGEAEFIIKSGGGMIAEEFAIGYTFSYSFVICQSPIIVQPSDFIGIKILNKRINFGDKIQVLWSLPSFFNPSENDSIAFFSPKISKAIYDKESFENNSQALYSGFVELKPNFAQKYNQNEIFAVGYFGYYDFFPIYRSEPFEIQLKNVGKNLQVDLLNLFLRQEFCDLTINYLDGKYSSSPIDFIDEI
ncbi:hypothetical protein M0811_08465 [Anaeramoeba ignava]|uniref:SKICH domain-containing protein n=1 Tax=Anaeramoeba ignava TaxID=1746090 RepID=A0A9Q0LLJ7_ANAIG|nr:hypothetical protein M0811_08465 [Anaeramoeba ignava]